MAVGWWICKQRHIFPYGDKAWHQEHTQGFVRGYLIPEMCTWEDESGPCMDSSSLVGPFPGRHEAEVTLAISRQKGLRETTWTRADPVRMRLETVEMERETLEAFRSGELDR